MKGVEYKIIGADGREYAASTLDELRRWVEDGRVAPGTWVWNGEEQRWQPASAWPELQWDFPAVPPVLPPVLPPPLVSLVLLPPLPRGLLHDPQKHTKNC